MRRTLSPLEKPLLWVASSKRDLLAMPEPVRRDMGIALSVAQHGGRHRAAKPWKGEGAGVFEVISDYDGDTYRSVYTVRYRRAIYVLHCFQQKSPSGVRTARHDIEKIHERLKAARTDYEARHGEGSED
jgi:phage-related protein